MTILTIDTEQYAAAARCAASSARQLHTAGSAVANTLSTAAGMAGWDSSGAEWASAYEPAARETLNAVQGLSLACADTALALTVAAEGYSSAEHVASLGTSPLMAPPPADVPGECLSVHLPAAMGNSPVALPEGWDIVAGLAGIVWPNADTAALRNAGNAWTSLADEVELTRMTAMAQVQSSVNGLSSADIQLLSERSGVTETAAMELAEAARELSRACRGYADSVEAAHAELIAETVAFTRDCAITLGITTGLSFVTLGGAAGIGALVGAFRVNAMVVRVTGIISSLAVKVWGAKPVLQLFPPVSRIASRLGVPGQFRLSTPALQQIVRTVKEADRVLLTALDKGTAFLAPAVTVLKRPGVQWAGRAVDNSAALLAKGPAQFLATHVSAQAGKALSASLASSSPAAAAAISSFERSAISKATEFRSAVQDRIDTAFGVADLAQNPPRTWLAGSGAAVAARPAEHLPERLTGVRPAPSTRPTVGPSANRQKAERATTR